MDDYIAVAIFANEVDAQLAQATLAAAGIESVISFEDVGHMLPSLQQVGGVRLMVDPASEEEARTILTSAATEAPDSPAGTEPPAA